MVKRTQLTIRGRRLNGLPAGTLICVVAILNMARHAEGCYVEQRISSLARDLSAPQWGGYWWLPIQFRMPGPSRPMAPEGAWLS